MQSITVVILLSLTINKFVQSFAPSGHVSSLKIPRFVRLLRLFDVDTNVNDLKLQNSDSTIKQASKEGEDKKKRDKKVKKIRDEKLFSRTNRIDGQEKWIKELFLYKYEQNLKVIENARMNVTAVLPITSPVLIIELAKELLYSGIPEQVLELYAAYYDIIVNPDVDEKTATAITSAAVAAAVAATTDKSIPWDQVSI